MKVLDLQRPHVTIFSGLLPPVASLLTTLIYHAFPKICNLKVVLIIRSPQTPTGGKSRVALKSEAWA